MIQEESSNRRIHLFQGEKGGKQDTGQGLTPQTVPAHLESEDERMSDW